MISELQVASTAWPSEGLRVSCGSRGRVATLSFDTGTIDEKTLARQLHKHDANDGAVLDDNNCAARFSARARVDVTFHATPSTRRRTNTTHWSTPTGGGA